jgi:scyllo-inosamine 4-kinase
VDLTGACRGRGWTNATWLTDEFVVRVAPEPGPADLLREQRLVALLPAEIGYPAIIDAGVWHGHEWVLTRRVAGENLEEVWPSLDHSARSGAVEQMWQLACQVHRVDVATVAPHARSRSPFFSRSVAEAAASLGRLGSAGELTQGETNGLGRALDRFWAALPGVPRALNHGDLCLPNTLWHGDRVVALLDFEFAVVAPTAIDLNEIVKLAFAPGDPDGRTPLREVVSRIAASALTAAGGPDVLIGYSIMLEAWLLDRHLAAGADIKEAERAESAAMLGAFAKGDGGYFAPLLATLC